MALLSLFFSSFGLLGLLGTAFWIWMLYECIQSGRAGQQWLWLLIFLNVIGAALYFVTQWLPAHPNFLGWAGLFNRRKMRDRLWQAEADAKNIGKPTQYIALGNLLFEMKQPQKATEAFQQALEQEPENTKALWGAAQAASNQEKYAEAKEHLETLLKVSPEFAYGEASMAYGEMLYRTENYDQAATHLETHLKNWTSPEGYLILATIQQNNQANPAAARKTLETMVIKIKGFVPFQYRKNEHFIRQAERKLKALPRHPST
ncbi:MAG: tetratricopeptide repeat protein [Cyanobacteria bacterium P01_F01_bin.53]